MREATREPLGELQLQVMEVVWELGDGTVAEVHDLLRQRREIAYTTVLSTLRNLEKRGYLRHTAEGRAHRFHPTVTRAEHRRASVQRLVSTLFEGRPEELVSHLLGDGELTSTDAQRIRDLLDSIDEEGAR